MVWPLVFLPFLMSVIIACAEADAEEGLKELRGYQATSFENFGILDLIGHQQ